MSGAPVNHESLGQQYLLFTGPLLVGLVLDWMLQGALVVQLYFYYNDARKDAILLKAVVYGIFVLDSIQTGFATAETWDMLVLNWGNPDIVAHPYWAGGVLPMMSGLISFCVQCFFAWRIYTLKPKRWVLGVSGLIVSASVTQCAASIIESAQFVADTTNLARIYPKHYIWLSGTLVADVLITVAMVGVLWDMKITFSRFRSTDRMIMRLILLSIEVGALTTIVAAAELAISKLYPQYFLYEVPAFILGKLSNISLLVSLNARSYVQGELNTTMGDESNPNNMRLTVPYSTHPDTGAATNSINTPKEIVTQELSYLDENYEQTHPTHTGGIHTPPKDIVTQDDSYLDENFRESQYASHV
ncbi:hypothetical protein C8J57DRAFT_150801 [Mycena rebaudengoi]|nr:hypothetical protein C8J57DRAFT_150801 [Mycena rebaudengoi]